MAGRDVAIETDENSAAKEGGGSLLDRVFALFLGSSDPEREKRRLLKQLGRTLSKSRQRLYKPKGQQALPGLGKVFFDVYQTVGPAQHLLQHADESSGLRDIVVESYFTDEQTALKEQFSEDRIRARAEKMDARELASELKDVMVQFFSSFDGALVKEINDTYNRLRSFVNLARYDYYFVLKKFDSSVQEQNFSAKPRFEPINGDYVSDDLKDFIEIAYAIETDADWDKVFDVFKAYRGVDMVSRPAWKKQLASLDGLRKSGVLVSIVQHIDEDPYYKPSPRLSRERIVEAYLNRAKTTTEATLQKIGNERRKRKIDQLCRAVFGTTAVARTKHYTEKANLVYSKRMLAGFIHTEAINYLKAFLIDYFKKDVREVVRDILLVRGRWSTNIMSQQLSEAFHQVLAISEQIVAFDDGLADEGELGAKLKKAMGRIVERDKSSANQLRQLLEEVNGRAKTMITDSGQNLVVMAKHLKAVIQDYERDEPELIMNWKQLEPMSETPLKERMVEMYKKIYYFVQLMQIYAKK